MIKIGGLIRGSRVISMFRLASFCRGNVALQRLMGVIRIIGLIEAIGVIRDIWVIGLSGLFEIQ